MVTSGGRKNPEIKLRGLDIDDLYLIALISEGLRLKDASDFLRISQPAITKRIDKLETITGIQVFATSDTRVKCVTPLAKQLGAKAIEALRALCSGVGGSIWELAVKNVGEKKPDKNASQCGYLGDGI